MVSGVLCSNCGASNQPSAKYCRNCSTPLGEQVPQVRPPAAQMGVAVKTGRIAPNSLVGGRYRIISKIGQGGMGAVYKVNDTRLGDIVFALKEMSTSALLDPADKQKAQVAFQREAQLLGTLSHPNLPRVTDYLSEGDKQFLVMDYVEGQPLNEYLAARKQQIPEEQVIKWAHQLCDVLNYLHTRNPPIIFRDIKPGNIMISRHGDSVKLIDFGIARFFKPGAQKDTMALGTPGYAPPEQYGKLQSDVRSDVYALGATLHHSLSLRDPSLQPFKFSTLRSLNPKISPHVESVIMRAVEPNPDHRWQTTHEMKEALKSIEALAFPAPAYSSASVATPSVASVIKPPHPPAPRTAHADLIPRLAAYLMDGIFISLVAFPIMLVITGAGMDEDVIVFVALLIFLLGLGYFAILHSLGGQTLGKKLAKIRVVQMDGSPVSFWRALWRALLFPFIAFLMVGFFIGVLFYIWPLFHKENRSLHDLLAGTKVIKT